MPSETGLTDSASVAGRSASGLALDGLTADGAHAPRSGPFLCALAPAIITGAVGFALADAAGIAAGIRLSATHWVLPALGVAGFAGALLAWRGRDEPPWQACLRRLVLAATLSLAPHFFQVLEGPRAWALPAVGALLGLCVSADIAAVARTLRASRHAREEFLFQHRGLSRLGVIALIATFLVAAGADSLLGAMRTLLVGAALVLCWTPPTLARTHGVGTWGRPVLGVGLAIALGGALLFLSMPILATPLPKTTVEQFLVEPMARPTPTTTMWIRATEAGAVIRVHDASDLPIYENHDERRLADALIHPAATLAQLSRVLIIGNESGAVAEQVLRYPEAREVVHVSLIPGLARAFKTQRLLRLAHGGALGDPRVRILEVEHMESLPAVLAPLGQFPLVVVATGAPLTAIQWVWSAQGRRVIAARVAPDGYLVGRLTSVSDTRFPWCFVQELAREGWFAAGYRVVLPSSVLDEILLVLASRKELDVGRIRGLRVPTRTLTEAHLPTLFQFGADQDYQATERTTPCADDLGVK